MSWRLIFAVLLIGLGASAWGGLQLGEWLVAHGPVAPTPPSHPELAETPLLDANGLPYTAQPPQPLVNGQLGVPSEPTQVAWHIPDLTEDEIISNPSIHLATTTISMDEAEALAGQGELGLHGIGDAGGLMGAATTVPPNAPLQPVEMAPPPPPPPPVATNNQAWQASLRQDLQACSAKGFFDRPSCAWAARKKYCEPNNAWGRVADCPAKSF